MTNMKTKISQDRGEENHEQGNYNKKNKEWI
jgi:hypothetical protein